MLSKCSPASSCSMEPMNTDCPAMLLTIARQFWERKEKPQEIGAQPLQYNPVVLHCHATLCRATFCRVWRGSRRRIARYPLKRALLAPTFSALKGGVALQVASWKVLWYTGVSQLQCRLSRLYLLVFSLPDPVLPFLVFSQKGKEIRPKNKDKKKTWKRRGKRSKKQGIPRKGKNKEFQKKQGKEGQGSPKPGCIKPGCLQILHAESLFCALLCPFCANLRSFAHLRLRSFALICALLRPTAFRTTAFGKF